MEANLEKKHLEIVPTVETVFLFNDQVSYLST